MSVVRLPAISCAPYRAISYGSGYIRARQPRGSLNSRISRSSMTGSPERMFALFSVDLMRRLRLAAPKPDTPLSWRRSCNAALVSSRDSECYATCGGEMRLLDLWQSDRAIENKRLEQIIAFAGDGRFAENNETSREFRE